MKKHLFQVLFLVLLLSCGGASTALPAVESAIATLPVPATSPVVSPSPTIPEPTAEPTTIPTQTPAQEPAPTPEPTDAPDLATAIVRIGSEDIPVELASTPQQKAQGLSDRLTLPANTGMLFPYQQQSRYNFWMKDMHFPLDIVWIGADCRVVDVTWNALPPAPGQTLEELPFYSPKLPAQYVLEINAGEAQSKGIEAGSPVAFTGIDGC